MGRLTSRHRLIAALLIASATLCSSLRDDDLVSEARGSCYSTKDSYSCVKYRALRYLSSLANGDAWTGNATLGEGKSFGMVQIEDEHEDDGEGYFGDSRQLDNDSELDKFVKFGKRQVDHLLRSNAFTVRLPDGARAMDIESNEEARSSSEDREARGKKKKLQVMLPLLSLLSLFKVKLLLVPILLSVLFIKKLLILATLFLPSVLSTLKVCKMPHVPHHNQWGVQEGSSDYTAGGYGGGGYASASGGYSKDWAASRAYNGYKQQYEKQQPPQYRTVGDSAYSIPSNMVYAASAAANL